MERGICFGLPSLALREPSPRSSHSPRMSLIFTDVAGSTLTTSLTCLIPPWKN